jgi:hypothetical protein
MRLSVGQKIKIEETLKDFLCLIPRYLEVKGNPKLYDMFLSRNRNPLFDMTGTKFWETGLLSEGAKNTNGKKVKDHYIPRKLAMGFIMDELVNNPHMSVDDFIILCKKYASTVTLTEEEHNLVTLRAKNTGRPNYEFYSSCGIFIEGIDGLITNI